MSIKTFNHILIFTLLSQLVTLSVSSDPAALSPAPPPQLGSDDSPPLPSAVPPPSPSPSLSSPPSPSPSTPSDLSPSPSTPSDQLPTPSPAPEIADNTGDVSAKLNNEQSDNTSSSSGGMSGGKKAGIAIGVIAAACVVGFGGVLYKKRQQNIRRAEFSSAARREFL